MDFKGKRVLVCGMARSGFAAAALLVRHGAFVTLQDIKDEHKFERELSALSGMRVSYCFGKNPDDIVTRQELIVLSPGIPQDLPFVQKALTAGVPVWSEVELAYRFCAGKIMAITGTNGKTTTTALCFDTVKRLFPTSECVGNIGVPFCEKCEAIGKNDFAVAEISSFQLENIHRFRPHIAAVLNVTPDHLNRHKTMDNYIAMKARIFENQLADDYAVLNYDDAICRDMARHIRGRVIFFSRNENLPEGVYMEDDNIRVSLPGFDQCMMNVNGMQIFGSHNVENALAAVAMAFCAGVPPSVIAESFMAFPGVEHRIEYVTEINGVSFYNDSKATNTDAAIKSIQAMKEPIVLICGGYDKNADFSDWVKKFEGKVRHAVILGEVSNQIAETCKAYNFMDFDQVNSLKDAIELGYSKARKGDCVLLSPACASFDMFDNFEQRGRVFKEHVWKLRG